MKLLMITFVASLSLVGCKKKEPPPAATETAGSAMAAGSATTGGSAMTEGSAATAPAAGSDAVQDAGAAAAAPTGSAAGSNAGTGPRADCVLYAKVSKSCTKGLKDEATIADECERALTKNTVMAGSINIQIACAKADPACDPFYKCIAKH